MHRWPASINNPADNIGTALSLTMLGNGVLSARKQPTEKKPNESAENSRKLQIKVEMGGSLKIAREKSSRMPLQIFLKHLEQDLNVRRSRNISTPGLKRVPM